MVLHYKVNLNFFKKCACIAFLKINATWIDIHLSNAMPFVHFKFDIRCLFLGPLYDVFSEGLLIWVIFWPNVYMSSVERFWLLHPVCVYFRFMLKGSACWKNEQLHLLKSSTDMEHLVVHTWLRRCPLDLPESVARVCIWALECDCVKAESVIELQTEIYQCKRVCC